MKKILWVCCDNCITSLEQDLKKFIDVLINIDHLREKMEYENVIFSFISNDSIDSMNELFNNISFNEFVSKINEQYKTNIVLGPQIGTNGYILNNINYPEELPKEQVVQKFVIDYKDKLENMIIISQDPVIITKNLILFFNEKNQNRLTVIHNNESAEKTFYEEDDFGEIMTYYSPLKGIEFINDCLEQMIIEYIPEKYMVKE